MVNSKNESLRSQPIDIHCFSLSAFPLGHKGWHSLNLFDGLLTPVCIPVVIAKGREQGPTVLAVAGVHGDEFEGIAAIHDFFRELDTSSMRGTFIGIPVANTFAFEGQMRETPTIWDGLNLARQFPGLPTGSFTQRLAHALSTWAIRILGSGDAFIDFHSAGTRYEYLSMVGFHPTGGQNEENSKKMAVSFGMERIWKIPDSPASQVTFNGYLARRGIPTIGTEVCGRGGMIEADVRSLQAGIENILHCKGMLSSPRELQGSGRPSSSPVWSTSMVYIQTSGLFRPCVFLDERIEPGQLLGRITSATGETLEELRSPATGRIWGMRCFSSVRAGDYVFLIGTEEIG